MTYGFDTPIDFIPLERGRLSRRNPFFSQIAPGAVILALGALFGYWTLYVRPAPAPKLARAPTVAAPVRVASNPYGALADPRSASDATPASSSSGSTSALLAQPFPLEASLEPNSPEPSAAGAEPESTAPKSAESAPLPVPRPADLASPASRSPLLEPGRRLAQQNARTAPAAPAADNRSFFDKVFAMVQPSTAPASSAPSRQVLAYAAPDDGAVSPVQRLTAAPPPARAAGGTAIYDVSAHTVYMPDGTRLEAHSGLGQLKDDPRYVSERMRGPTPPAVYDLQPREQLFHGVKALRLTPVGGAGVYGRTGLLAHRYMLGPNGDSNGCVSFRDYNAFLQAYERGQVQRLVVVARSN
jgi:hypothetical protein